MSVIQMLLSREIDHDKDSDLQSCVGQARVVISARLICAIKQRANWQ